MSYTVENKPQDSNKGNEVICLDIDPLPPGTICGQISTEKNSSSIFFQYGIKQKKKELPDVSKAEVIDTITIDDDFETISTNLSSSNDEEIESPSVNLELLEQNRIETIEIDDDGNESLNHKIVYNFPNIKGSPLISCKVCNFKAKHSQPMINHLIDIHSSKFMCCNECDFKGTTLNSLARHWMRYHRSLAKNSTVSFNDKELLAVSFGQKYLYCTVCKFKTILRNHLVDHLIENHTNKVFVCDICPFRGDSADALDKHKEDVHNKRKYPPLVDVFSENETDQNQEHSSTSINKPYNYECQRCKYKTNMKIALIRHMYSVHRRIWVDDRQDSVSNIPEEKEKKYTFFCNFCSFKTDSKNQLYLHKEQVHQDGKIFLCTLCKFQSPLMSELKEHLLTNHAKNSPFTCATCSYQGKSQNDLNTHILLNHKTEKHYTCSQCIFITKSENDFKNHLNEHNIPKCKICSFSAPDEVSLDRHTLLAHVSGKPFTCKYCVHFSSKREDFYEHVLKKHSDLKSFPCRLCNHVSETEKDFDKHLIEVHVKELQFSCDRCKYRTNVKTELTQHLQTLHGFVKGSLSNKVIMVQAGTPDLKDNPFSCDKCQFRTNLKSSLTQHLQQFHKPLTDNIKLGKVIMGEVFVCNVCGFKTIGKNELQLHMQKTHQSYDTKPEQNANEILYRIFSCGFCDYKTDQKTDLDKHIKKFHLNCNKVTTVMFKNQDTTMLTDLHEDYNTRLTADKNIYVSLNQILSENSISIKDENTDNHDSIEDNINSNKTKMEKLEIDKDLINNSDQENKAEIFYCRGCDFKTNIESDLYPHVLETHINPIQPKSTTLFNCDFCDFISDQESDLKTHSVKHHNSKIDSVKKEPCLLDKDEIIVLEDDDDDIFFCSFCKFKTTEKKDLNDHTFMMHKIQKENNSNECEIITIDDEEDYINVILSKEETMIYPSTEEITTTNNSSIKQEVSLKTEYEVGHLELDCIDRIQNGFINTRERAVGHIKIEVPKENTLKCTEFSELRKLPDIEGECLSNREKLKKYGKTNKNKIKMDKGDYSCGLCPFKTKNGNVLELHVLEFHNHEPVKGKKPKIINNTSCSLCNFQSNHTRDLNMHIITVHWKQKVLHCDKCEYLTSKEDELLEHNKVCHKNKLNKTLVCYVCKYQANNIQELKKHLKSCRKSSNSFCCSYCDFQTSRKVDLMIHLNQFHSRDKLFSCNDCGYYTKHPSFLKTHIKNKHTKYFCCSYCGFKTKSNNNLKSHVANLHRKKKLFTCDICNCDMRLKSLLLKHLQSKHKEIF